MKVKVITLATYDGRGLDMLKKSLNKHGADYEILCRGEQWKGFGMKVIEVRKYLETIKDQYTHFIFVDAYDVAFVKSIEQVKSYYLSYYNDEILFSAEKACWPVSELSVKYPACEYPWKYLNAGSLMAPIEKYLKVTSCYPIEYASDDQLYFTNIFLDGKITLDTKCRIFQSIAFEHEGDFRISYNRFYNQVTNTMPMIVHGNGRTPMDKIYSLI